MRAFGDAIADDADRGDAKNSDAAGGGRSRCRRRGRRTDAGSGGARSNRSRSDRSPTLVAELRARVQSCAARIAECHTSPRKSAVRKSTARVYRRLGVNGGNQKAITGQQTASRETFG